MASPAQLFRLGVVVVLCAIWLWVIPRVMSGQAEIALVASTGLGVAAWVAPVESRGLRLAVRAVGTAIGLAGLGLLVAVILAVRSGL